MASGKIIRHLQNSRCFFLCVVIVFMRHVFENRLKKYDLLNHNFINIEEYVQELDKKYGTVGKVRNLKPSIKNTY